MSAILMSSISSYSWPSFSFVVRLAWRCASLLFVMVLPPVRGTDAKQAACRVDTTDPAGLAGISRRRCNSACPGARRSHRLQRFLALHDLGEEIVALVIDHDERGKIDDVDLPYRLHAELRVFEHLDVLDAVLCEASGGAADAAQVEATVLLAGLGHRARAVALGEHHEAAALGLESV